MGNKAPYHHMAKGFPTESRRAFLDRGALVFGGIGGAGAYYLMFGDILQTVLAIGGAWLAHYLVRQANEPAFELAQTIATATSPSSFQAAVSKARELGWIVAGYLTLRFSGRF